MSEYQYKATRAVGADSNDKPSSPIWPRHGPSGVLEWSDMKIHLAALAMLIAVAMPARAEITCTARVMDGDTNRGAV